MIVPWLARNNALLASDVGARNAPSWPPGLVSRPVSHGGLALLFPHPQVVRRIYAAHGMRICCHHLPVVNCNTSVLPTGGAPHLRGGPHRTHPLPSFARG